MDRRCAAALWTGGDPGKVGDMRVVANGLHDGMRGVFGVDEHVYVRGGAAYGLQGVCDIWSSDPNVGMRDAVIAA